MIVTPNRRWFRFSLRTLFVAVALLSLAMAWLARTASILRERNEMIQHTTSFSLDTWPKPLSWRIASFLFGYRQGSVYWDGITVDEDMTDQELE